MTGRYLIKWILDHHAEDMVCVAEYPESYEPCGTICSPPSIARYERDPEGHPYDVKISYTDKENNCFVISC